MRSVTLTVASRRERGYVGFFKRVEERVFLGEVIRDYGVISEFRKGGAKLEVKLLLCEKGGEKQLVFRQSAKALLGASVTYQYVKQEDMAYLKQSTDEAVQLSQP